MSAIPPGWYDDGHGALRWWDGAAWTEHVAEAVPELVEAPAVTAPGEGGAFTAATDGKRSSLWIVWVVLGVVLLAVVFALAVLVPIIALRSTAESVSSSLAEDSAEQSAADVVDAFEASWLTADCDAFFGATTEAFRASAGLDECAEFTAQAALVDRAVDDYTYTLTDIDHEDGTVVVLADVSFQSLVDPQGAPLARPEPVSYTAEYVLVPAGEAWAIDQLN